MVLKKNARLLYFIALYITFFAANIGVKLLYPQWARGPNQRLPGVIVINLFLLGYALYSWKFDMPAFLKRFYISIPFSVVFMLSVLVWCSIKPLPAHSAKPLVVITALIVCVFLLFKTPNWKQHFLAVLIPAFLSMIFSKFFLMPSTESRDTLLATFLANTKTALSFAGNMVILSFFLLYLSKLLERDKTPDLKTILIRSLKFSIALLFLFGTFLLLCDIGDKLDMELPTQLLLQTLAAISFLIICYRFDLLLIERKNVSGKNILSGFWNQLHNLQGKTKPNGMCERCGKPTPQELLFKTDSDKRVCAACLAKRE